MGRLNWKAFKDVVFDKEHIEEYKYDIREQNLSTMFMIATVGTVISAILSFLGLPFIGVLELGGSYIFLTLVFVLVMIAAKTLLKQHGECILPVYYALMIFLQTIAIYMGTVQGQTTNATTFILFLLLAPLFIIDAPWKLITVNVIMTIVFINVDIAYKASGEILSLDISNAMVVLFLSIIFVVITEKRNIHIFEMQKKEEEELRKKDTLINAIPAGIAIFEVKDQEVETIYQNEGYFRLFEDTRESRAKRTNNNFMNCVHPEDRMKVGRAIKNVIDGKNYITLTCRALKGDDTYMWIRFSAAVGKREDNFISVYCTYASMEEEMKSKQATQAKTDFLSRMSHDIRTPMNAIIGMTNLAKEEEDLTVIK